jgi:ABC-2 type transport system ATP-binding protein
MMLEVKHVAMSYGEVKAVQDLSFTIQPGEIFGLLGTNGAGKTTTFRMIMGLIKPKEGSISYFNHEVSYDDVNTIGYMIEERSLLTKVTVKDLMMYLGQLKDVSKEDIETRLDYWLERFGISSYKTKKVKELSKGNQQKIQFIAALINNPKLLILDEPFSGLDPINTEIFVSAIRDFQKQGAMVIFSSHQLDHVESFCEKIVVLEKGKVILEGPIQEIKEAYQKLNIKIKAKNIDIDVIQSIEGVINVDVQPHAMMVKVSSKDRVKDVFNYIKTCDDVMTFDVLEPPLSEIFIDKVKNHEKT